MGAEALFLAAAPYPPLVALLAGRFRPGVRIGLLVALAALALMPFAVVGMEWGWLPWTVGAGVLVALPPRASWPLLGAVLAATVATGPVAGVRPRHPRRRGPHPGAEAGGQRLRPLRRPALAVPARAAARGGRRAAAVAAERDRIGRDLHDVLGFSLSAVALRGEPALRLLDRDPVRAATELAALVPVLERAHAELGAIAGGRVLLEPRREVDAAIEVLEAAGIAVRAEVETGPLPDGTGTALAAVLREAVTNVLRHSRARTCTITVTRADGAVRLRVVDDGAGGLRAPAPSGTGLESLAARAGGRLSAGPRRGGGFEVVAEFRSDPAGLGGDADGVDPVAGADLADR
jgi:two-component system sensor histidine kinase DesK